MGLMALNQLTAINTVMYYGTSILRMIGLGCVRHPNLNPEPWLLGLGLGLVRVRVRVG